MYNILMKNLLITTLMIIIFSVTVNAETMPWDKYSQFIPSKTPVVKRAFRSMWICTVFNIDWPSVDTKLITDPAKRIAQSKTELIKLLDNAVDMNMNSVILQVSPCGDAVFKSKLVPWSTSLTGTFGKDPGFDPLEFAIEEAHKRNLEIHAWFNPYRISTNTNDATKSSLNIDKSVYKEHPDWIKTSMGGFVVDPGIPDARKWVEDRVMEVINNYDIDGIHFDDYFYYEKNFGELNDQSTYAKYNNGQFQNIKDFRRNNTYLLIKELSSKIKSAKPWVKFGISPSAVWANKSTETPDGSATTAGLENYVNAFADTKKWVNEEIIDYIAPQIYFSFANKYVPYGEIATWWANVCKGKNVHLYIGQSLNRINGTSDTYFNGKNAVDEFSRQLKFNISKPEILGSIEFSAIHLTDTNKQDVINNIKNNIWNTKSLIPVMPWKNSKTPIAPSQGKLESNNNKISLSWTDNDPNTAYFAIYRFKKGDTVDLKSDSSANNLIATVRKTDSYNFKFVDSSVNDINNVFYVVSSLDRLHNESNGLIIKNSISKYFSDIGSEYSWANEAIDSLYEKKIITGYSDGTFNPGQKIKRCDFVLMISKAFKLKADFTDNFIDVPKNSYYYDVVGIYKKLGIINGSNGYFFPTNNITREDLMVIMVRALKTINVDLGTTDENTLLAFSDADKISPYAKESVSTLVKLGIINGYNGLINPKLPATRAEISVIFKNMLDKFQR